MAKNFCKPVSSYLVAEKVLAQDVFMSIKGFGILGFMVAALIAGNQEFPGWHMVA